MKTNLRFFICTCIVFFLSFFLSVEAYSQLSENVIRQIDSLNREKESRTPSQKKIDSRLLQAVKEKRGEKMVKGVDLDPANVSADVGGNLEVDIKAEVSDELINKIEKLGGKIIYPSKPYHTIRAQIKLSMVETIAAYSEVQFIEPAAQVRNNGAVRPGIKP